MTKEQLLKMDFEDAIRVLSEESNFITSYDTLKDFAVEKLKDDNVGLALHILEAIYNTYGEWYDYDYCMGTLETPTPLLTIEDLEDYCEQEEQQ
ncbi:MAG: hypothetical protein PHW00_06255 [Clostridia bacterium]|nr:hypothetical protein [Clostridia bacterium]